MSNILQSKHSRTERSFNSENKVFHERTNLDNTKVLSTFALCCHMWKALKVHKKKRTLLLCLTQLSQMYLTLEHFITKYLLTFHEMCVPRFSLSIQSQRPEFQSQLSTCQHWFSSDPGPDKATVFVNTSDVLSPYLCRETRHPNIYRVTMHPRTGVSQTLTQAKQILTDMPFWFLKIPS